MRIIEEMTNREIIEELGKRSKMLFVNLLAENTKDSVQAMVVNKAMKSEVVANMLYMATELLPMMTTRAIEDKEESL